MYKTNLLSKMLLLITGVLAGVTGAWAETKTITLTYDSFGLTTNGYSQKTATVNGFSFTVNQGYKGSNNSIQMNSSKGNGTLYNTTAIKGLKSIQVNVSSGDKTYTITSGTAQNPTTNSQTGSTTGTYNVTSGDTFFQLKVSGASYFSSIVITYDEELAKPTFSPISGAVAYGTTVTLTQDDAAMILYTTNGDTPSFENNVGETYSDPISITSATTIKAIAVDDDGNESEVAEASYTIATPDAPTFSLAAGAVAYNSPVTITAGTGCVITYTTDNSDPMTSSTAVTSEGNTATVNIKTATTIRAIALDGGANESEEVTASYTVAAPAAPTFSPVAGGVDMGTTVTLTADVDMIIYTTDGSTPSFINNVGEIYTTPITINAPTTIKAIAVDDGGNESEVATAKYSIKMAGESMTIDFEKELSTFTDWNFTNISRSGNITAHNGTFYGRNYATNGASTTASIQTHNKINYPNQFTCYLSKESGNTNADSKWYIQISSDGTNWTNAGSHTAAAQMKEETWYLFTADLSNYSNVYVRLYYYGTNAFRCVDDIELTTFEAVEEVVPAEIGSAGLATFSSEKAVNFTSVNAIEAYTATVTTDGKMTFNRIYKVPANTGLLLRNAAGEDQGAVAAVNVPVIDNSKAETVTGNALVAVSETINSLPTADTENNCTNFILNKVSDNVGFFWANGQKVAAGKAYLRVPTATAEGVRSFAISFSDSTSGIESISSTFNENQVYDLQGRRVAQPAKGLYIVNGKKVVRK